MPIDQQCSDILAWLRSIEPTSAATMIARGVQNWQPREADLWNAGTLTAARFINNQAHNFLGMVSHALIGCEEARRLAAGQPAHLRLRLLCQALHAVVRDMYDPCFSPFELADFWPIESNSTTEGIGLLRRDVAAGEYMRADHRLCGLRSHLTNEELVDLILDIGLEGILTDEHTLISAVLYAGACDRVGWDSGFPMLRWAVRYSASFPRDIDAYTRSIHFVDKHSLSSLDTDNVHVPSHVRSLANALSSSAPELRPEIAAQALASGTSCGTVLAAASLAACRLYLMVAPIPCGDFDTVSRELAPIHIGTVLNALREAIGRMAPRTRVLAALQAGHLLARGPGILDATFTFVRFVPARSYPYEEDVAALTRALPRDLLIELRDRLASGDIRFSTAAVQAYADSGEKPEPLIRVLVETACTDSGTLMHNIKHLNSMVEEFWTSPDPERWSFLVAAARFAAWYAGRFRDVYDEVVAVTNFEEQTDE